MAETHPETKDPQLPPGLLTLSRYSSIAAGVSITVYVIYNIFICGCG